MPLPFALYIFIWWGGRGGRGGVGLLIGDPLPPVLVPEYCLQVSATGAIEVRAAPPKDLHDSTRLVHLGVAHQSLCAREGGGPTVFRTMA